MFFRHCFYKSLRRHEKITSMQFFHEQILPLAKLRFCASCTTANEEFLKEDLMENLTIKVYGSGCKGCQTLHQNVIDALAEMNIAADVQYITDMQKIMEAGIMGMPALAVNDKIVSSGKVLSVADVKKYLG